MKAHEVKDGDWFYVIRTKSWYKRVGVNLSYVEATVIGDNTQYNIPKDEDVEVKK